MPIGVNHIESVNVYLVEDGDSVTLVDCGMWQPGEPDDGLQVQAARRPQRRAATRSTTSHGSSSPTTTTVWPDD